MIAPRHRAHSLSNSFCPTVEERMLHCIHVRVRVEIMGVIMIRTG
jgi:hypothetical protein